MKAKQYVLTPTGEKRPPKLGEWYEVHGRPSRAPDDLLNPHTILKLEEREVEIEEPTPAWIVAAVNECCDVGGSVVWRAAAQVRILAKRYREAKERGEA